LSLTNRKHICLCSFPFLILILTYEHVGKYEQQQHRFRWMDGVTVIQNQKQPLCFIFLLSSDLCHLRWPSSWSILYICWSSSNCHPRNPWSSLFSGNFYSTFSPSDFMHNHLYDKRLYFLSFFFFVNRQGMHITEENLW